MEDIILRHLLDYETITSWEAIQEYGCSRLSHYIWLLRNHNYIIDDEWIHTINRYGMKVKYKKYILRGNYGTKKNVQQDNNELR